MHLVGLTAVPDELTEPGRRQAFICLVAFLVAFIAIRTSARMARRYDWWPGSVHTDGVHLHHHVWGIFLMIVAGFAAVAEIVPEPLGWMTAVVFGAGVGLTLDEFALWTHLEDVYWTDRGRSSIQAVAVVAALGVLVVLGVQPFSLADPVSAISVSAAIALTLVVCVVALLKGRLLLGSVGLFLLPVGLIGALRLAHPASPWAGRFYAPGSRREERSRARFRNPDRRGLRVRTYLVDLIGGRPSRH
jgi:hypothetical protein